jgi:hypothetical protein
VLTSLILEEQILAARTFQRKHQLLGLSHIEHRVMQLVRTGIFLSSRSFNSSSFPNYPAVFVVTAPHPRWAEVPLQTVQLVLWVRCLLLQPAQCRLGVARLQGEQFPMVG